LFNGFQELDEDRDGFISASDLGRFIALHGAAGELKESVLADEIWVSACSSVRLRLCSSHTAYHPCFSSSFCPCFSPSFCLSVHI
jgi:hypothetical protein